MSRLVNVVFLRDGARLEFAAVEDATTGEVLEVGKWLELEDDMCSLQLRISDRSFPGVESQPYVSQYQDWPEDPTLDPVSLDLPNEDQRNLEVPNQPPHDPRMAKL